LKQPHFIDAVNAPKLNDDEAYAEFIRTREKSVFGELFRKHMTLVYGVCMKYLHEKQASQDATMEVFEKLLTYEPKSEIRSFRAFLYVVSKNHCLMKIRGEKPVSVDFSEADMESASYVHPIDRPDDKTVALEKCLKQLNEAQNACIGLFYYEKRSYLEISRLQKLTLNAVKSHIQNGKRNLKQCLETSK